MSEAEGSEKVPNDGVDMVEMAEVGTLAGTNDESMVPADIAPVDAPVETSVEGAVAPGAPEAAPAPAAEPTPASEPAPAHITEPAVVAPTGKVTLPPLNDSVADSVEKGMSLPPSTETTTTPASGGEPRKTSDFKAPNPPLKELTDLEKFKKRVRGIFDSMPAAIIMSVVTLWALFGDDIRVATASPEADAGFTVSLTICFFMFVIEFAAGCFASPEYTNFTYDFSSGEPFEWKHVPGSFYFYLDIIATASLGSEISWMNPNIHRDNYNAKDWVDSGDYSDSVTENNSSKRFVEMIRMVRIVRMVKFYKYYQINQKRREAKAKAAKRAARQRSFNKKTNAMKDTKVEEVEVGESNVGQAMTDLTTQRVLVLVFSLLFVIPFFTEADSNFEARYMAKMVDTFLVYYGKDNTGFNSTKTELIDYLEDDKDTLCVISTNNDGFDEGYVTDKGEAKDTLEEYRPVQVTVMGSGGYYVFHDYKSEVKEAAELSMGLTAFITVLLMAGTMVFSMDVRSLVITPIEKMVELVQKISVNPLGVDYSMMDDDDAFTEGMETTLLLQTINKIGSLMRVGFGEAGANVIAKNLAESKGGKLNMMGAGTTIRSIFGFCDVRQFTDTTECLQEEVMLFVNRIAHILHSIVVQCSGAANKNIGDAFLLTWKLEEGVPPARHTSLADQALVAFLKGLVELNRHQDFICNFSVAATARLYKRFPGYNVRIGCGLHVGWAIEGAIGTFRKIDASYLSPSVNMSEYLESSTKAYGVPILLSEPFWKLLSPNATKYCRQVDRIFGPLEEPFGMYTYDADLDYDFNAVVATTSALKAASVFKSKLAARKAKRDSVREDGRRRSSMFGNMFQGEQTGGAATGARPKRNSMIQASAPQAARRASAFNDIEMQKISEQQKKLAEERKNKAPEIKVNAYEKGVWERDADLIQLRHLVNDSFRVTWSGGIQAYIDGDWSEAIRVFTQTLDISKGSDGPSKFLINLMNEHGGRAPADWKGYRLD